MPRRKSTTKPPLSSSAEMSVLLRHAAGIDVGATQHWVCVGDDSENDVRSFGVLTGDLAALADWLRERGATHVAMEATGVYWIPLFELLESRGFEVILVEPSQTARKQGRPKTDVQDCQWIRRLHSFGLLSGSFRPNDRICELRGYLRRRLTLVSDATRYVQQMQKALNQMNVRLNWAVSDITGKTGMAIIQSILKGERDPATLARNRDRRCVKSEEEIAKALEGNWREEHLFALQQAHDAWHFCQRQLRDCDRRMADCLKRLAPDRPRWIAPRSQKPAKRKSVQSDADLRPLLAQLAGVDLCAIEGIDVSLATVMLAEVGPDVSAFPTEKHFGSWLGLAPNPKRSGRYMKKSRSKPSANRVATAFRLAAQALYKSQTALGAFYRRLKARLGSPKALTATAYKIARIVYRMLKHGTEYVQQGLADYERQFRDRALRSLTRRANQMGYTLTPTDQPVF